MTTNEDFEEIYLERLRYLINIDDMWEQMLEYRHTVHIVKASHGTISGIGQKNSAGMETGLALA